MFRLFYNIFIYLYPQLIAVASLRNPKARLWIAGRKQVFELLEEKLKNNTQKLIWMHCASLGEFEQGRPVLEALRTKHPEHTILLTFFSPSGYEVRKNYTGADIVCYLPMDSRSHAIRFFNIVQPSLVIFVKYEYWYYYLQEAKKRKIETIIISAIFFRNQIFFKWYGSLHRQMLKCFTAIFVQNQDSLNLLNELNGFNLNDLNVSNGLNDVFISGDTRFDSVINNLSNQLVISEIEMFVANRKVIVAGSTWPEDDKVLKDISGREAGYSLIVAPHDIGKERLEQCLYIYSNAQLYSDWKKAPIATTNTIIIDNVGMLSALYRYATICFVGGGWGKDGIHNILEAAVFGKPVIFGPVFHQFIEAEELIKEGGAFSVDNLIELQHLLHKLDIDPVFYALTAEKAQKFVLNRGGATRIIINKIETF